MGNTLGSPDDIRRLIEGPTPGEVSELGPPVWYRAECRGDAADVLCRAKEVLLLVLRQDPDNWPSDEQWRTILPQWFVAQCAPEKSREEQERDNTRWLNLSAEEQAREGRSARWSLRGWMQFFDTWNADWYWWDAIVADANTLFVGVVVEGLPFGSGSLEWLFISAGAHHFLECREPELRHRDL